MIGLLDLKNAYCSMEAVFDPSIRGRPVVVASNGDGCVVARSAEAKALGIGMGQPIHEIDPKVRRQLVIRSANFTLYGSLSNRVYNLVRQSVPVVERYSIDEQFMGLWKIADREGFAAELSERVRRYTGLANRVGIGRTRTIAKMANKLAAKGTGILDLSDPGTHDDAFAAVEIGDVWGVGRRWAPRLQGMGILTAKDLRDADSELIGKMFGVVLLRTQRELRGRPCAGLQATDPDRQTIAVSRTFGARVSDPGEVMDAVATFAVRAAEKARQGGLVASAVQVFAHSDWFRQELPQHHPSCTYTLPLPTSDTRLVLATVRRMLEKMLRPGIGYKKAGVMLLGLERPVNLQADMFSPGVMGDEGLMSALDEINRRFGRGTLKFASAAGPDGASWRPRQHNLSPCYTTRLSDLPIALC